MEKIFNRLPVDKTASLVVSKSDEQGFTRKKYNCIRSLKKLPTIMYPYLKENDLTGMKKDRLTVIGFSGCSNQAKGQCTGKKWIVKCACGYYEVKSTKALKNPNFFGKCETCKHLDFVKHLNEFEKRNNH